MPFHHKSYAMASNNAADAATGSSVTYTLLGGLVCSIVGLMAFSQDSTMAHYVSAATISVQSTGVRPTIDRPVMRAPPLAGAAALPSRAWQSSHHSAGRHGPSVHSGASTAPPLQQGPIALLMVMCTAGAVGLAGLFSARGRKGEEQCTRLLEPLAIDAMDVRYNTLPKFKAPVAMASTSGEAADKLPIAMASAAGESAKEDNSSASTVTMSPIEDLLVGASAGVLKILVAMPLLTWKFCAQAGSPLPVHLPDWYRGIVVQATAVAPIASLQMLVNGTLQKVLSGASPLSAKLKRELTTLERLLAALGAGIVSAVIHSPVDLLTIQQQQLGMSLASCASRIMQDYGPLGFVRGLGAMAVREGIFTLGMFGLTPIFSEALQKNIKRLKSNTVLANLLGSLGAGITAALLTHPMDTVKTQIQNDMMGVTYKNILNTLNLLVESKGWGALYIGSIPRTLMICVAFFIVNMLRKIYLGWKTRRLQQQG